MSRKANTLSILIAAIILTTQQDYFQNQIIEQRARIVISALRSILLRVCQYLTSILTVNSLLEIIGWD